MMHPQPRMQNKSIRVSHHGHTGNHPAFPAQWFYGLLRDLPGDRAFCHRRLRIWRGKTRLGSHASANLTPASRRQNHTTSPSAKSAVRLRAIRQLTGLVDPPCHPLTSPDAAASTASRPALMTCATPLFRDGTAMDLEVIWVRREGKYFCKGGWIGIWWTD